MSQELNINSLANTLFYGGNGGSYDQIQHTGGQSLVICGGSSLDSIQIGNKKYGGSGGGKQIVTTLPQNGQFQILELCAGSSRPNNVGYIKISCQGQTYTAGTESGNGKLVFGGNALTVTFAGIRSGAFIDAIVFNIIS